MFGYEFSCTISDDVFGTVSGVVTVDAESIPQAQAKALCQPGVVSVDRLLGAIDCQPQVFLAW